MLDLTDHQLSTIGTWVTVAMLLWMVGEHYLPKLWRRPMTAREMMAERSGLLGGLWENRTLILAVIGLVIVGWLHFRENSALPPIQGYTEAQLNDAKEKAVAEATKPIQDKLDQAIADNTALRQSISKQIDAAVAKATAQAQAQIAQLQSDAPINVEKLPTSLKILFKGDDIEEQENKNIIWTQIPTSGEQKIPTVFGERSNTVPLVALILVFKKPIIFKDIVADNHGVSILPLPDVQRKNPRYAILTFNGYNYFPSVLVDLTVK